MRIIESLSSYPVRIGPEVKVVGELQNTAKPRIKSKEGIGNAIIPNASIGVMNRIDIVPNREDFHARAA